MLTCTSQKDTNYNYVVVWLKWRSQKDSFHPLSSPTGIIQLPWSLSWSDNTAAPGWNRTGLLSYPIPEWLNVITTKTPPPHDSLIRGQLYAKWWRHERQSANWDRLLSGQVSFPFSNLSIICVFPTYNYVVAFHLIISTWIRSTWLHNDFEEGGGGGMNGQFGDFNF